MLRMEIALFLVLVFVACIYFSAGKRDTLLHRTFTYLLITVLVHLVTPKGNYSDGPYAIVCYGSVIFYLLLCAGLLIANWKGIDRKKRFAMGASLLIEFTVCALQGLKNKGYRGEIAISVQRTKDGHMEICVRDTGSGFTEGKKEAIDQMLANYAKQAPKLTGNSIGILNVQKRIKLLCGRESGLWYTENTDGGVTAHILLPLEEKSR